MITRLKLKPGQKGTKKLHAEHGDALVCVRYRYDEKCCMRFKTVESRNERTPRSGSTELAEVLLRG